MNILVIKLGALGNVILSLRPFAAIRAAHPGARITLLTTWPYVDWLRRSPWFDDIWIDERPAWWDVLAVGRLRRRLTGGAFDRVYDLQTSSRSSWYFHLFPARSAPEWSGIARGCALPDRDPNRDRLHDADRQAGQIKQAGIARLPPVDLGWSAAEIDRFRLPSRTALLVPGSSAHRPEKRWPATHYAAIANELMAQGVTPLVLGTTAEAPLAAAISQAAPGAIDLAGRTDLDDITSLARRATVAVGNDTGPMHLIAAVDCPSVVLFSRDSDPELCAPRGARVRILRRDSIQDIPVASVRCAVADVSQPQPAG